MLLEDHKYFEDAFKAPAEVVKPLYLQYAKFEEDFGLAKRAMGVYDQATKVVPANEQLSMYEIYIARAAEIYGVPKTREIYAQAISSEGLPEKDAMKMCIKYAELEKSLGEIERARHIYVYASRLADPRFDGDFWKNWHEFEVNHGNEDTFRDMLRIKRSVSARHSQTHIFLPEYLQKPTIDEAMYQLRRAGVPEDEMEALERQLAPKEDSAARKLGFVSSSIQLSETASALTQNQEEIELPEGSKSDEEDDDCKVEIAQKGMPDAVYGGLVRKRDDKEAEKEKETGDGDTCPGALERIKRMRQEYLQKPTIDEAMYQLRRAGVPEDEMEALERQLAPKEDSAARKLGFVSSSIQLSETASALTQN
ncbi:RNA-processing protein, HAT helix [Artemisia annua]|uniref:RNA-processing protein, HAT helix n=1 Tax=Artemisia annua TaxID=35608 RepID=A0A2U1L6F3_ARTAN|nr:RNA-processing protein, HAT helix [Artemisia annua]